MTAERTIHGAWRITDIIGDCYITEQYFGYTKREAMAIFCDDHMPKRATKPITEARR